MSNIKVASQVEALVMEGKKITLKAIEHDLKNGLQSALFLAKYEQIEKLVKSGKIDSDFYAKHFDAQEEMASIRGEW